jgi:AraC-like DNA-binding protein
VGALVLEAAARLRLTSALATRFDVAFCDRCSELSSLARQTEVVMLIAEPRDRDGTSVAHVVARLRGDLSSRPILAYVPQQLSSSRDILDMANAGVTDLIRAGFDDDGLALRSALRNAAINCTSNFVRSHIAGVIPEDALPIVMFILDEARASLSVSEIARALGMSRRTLLRRLQRDRLPAPRSLIGWCRLILAARLMEDAGRTIESVALTLDFPSAASLRNMLWRYAHLRPTEIRGDGGARAVLQQFVGVLDRARAVELAVSGH